MNLTMSTLRRGFLVKRVRWTPAWAPGVECHLQWPGVATQTVRSLPIPAP